MTDSKNKPVIKINKKEIGNKVLLGVEVLRSYGYDEELRTQKMEITIEKADNETNVTLNAKSFLEALYVSEIIKPLLTLVK